MGKWGSRGLYYGSSHNLPLIMTFNMCNNKNKFNTVTIFFFFFFFFFFFLISLPWERDTHTLPRPRSVASLPSLPPPPPLTPVGASDNRNVSQLYLTCYNNFFMKVSLVLYFWISDQNAAGVSNHYCTTTEPSTAHLWHGGTAAAYAQCGGHAQPNSRGIDWLDPAVLRRCKYRCRHSSARPVDTDGCRGLRFVGWPPGKKIVKPVADLEGAQRPPPPPSLKKIIDYVLCCFASHLYQNALK